MIVFFVLHLLVAPTLQFHVESRASVCDCGRENVADRISGGSYASPNQYPWMVRLQQGCGGSLISDRHVLTAYHCVDDWPGNWVKVSVHNQWDSSDYQLVAVDRAVWPDRAQVGSHDIAVIILAEPVTFDETIHPVCLPTSSELVYQGEQTTHLGWGMTHVGSKQSTLLKHIDLTVSYATGYNKNYFYTDIEIIDGVPQDPCAGDSGGPLMHQDPTTNRWTIIGTVYGGGYDCRTGNGANSKGYWNKVTAHLDWIKDILAQDSETSACASNSVSTTAAPTTPISGPIPQLGEYELATGAFNDWHYVTISLDEEGGRWKWTNRAGVSWSLYLAGNNVLRVGDDCPYFNNGYTTAAFNETGIVGPWGEFYAKLGSSSCIYVDKKPQSSCDAWKQYGYCEESHRYSNYLLKNCKATCLCNSSSTCDYVDKYDSCPGWKDPYCTSHPNWMARNCPATCNCD